MNDRALKQMITDAVRAEVIGKTVAAVEVTLPNVMNVTFNTGLCVRVLLDSVVTPPTNFIKR